MSTRPRHVVQIAEPVWREAVAQHVNHIRSALQPGLTSPEHVVNSGRRRSRRSKSNYEWCTALNPKHPVYNFLIEYYGLKGAKGTRRLARWSPNPALLFRDKEYITSLNELMHGDNNFDISGCKERMKEGILLEGATAEDVGGVLHLRGSMLDKHGIIYSPASFFSSKEGSANAAAPFLWYRSVLQQTLNSAPVLHCHGLHEWAMQYHPPGADPPPSAKYQSHLPLRVSRIVINETVERRGISCTHVDALRYFSPAAGPLNHHGSSLQRTDQLRLEQPGCVHAHMDLLKMALRLQPFVDPSLLRSVLDVALESRKLDVAASPYDATAYGICIVPIETAEGRWEYRKQQVELMERADPVRRQLLRAYDLFLSVAFDESIVERAQTRADPERFAKAEPGGLPWRKNLIDKTQITQ